MYLEYYGLSQKPFNLTPGPEFVYFSKQHQLAMSMLEYGMHENAGGITVITGEIGAGKTTLIRRMMQGIDYDRLTVGFISNTHQNFGNLLQWVALAFNIDHSDLDQVSLYRKIQRFMISEYAQGKTCVVIVDEAQNMSAEALEELRLITNINADGDQLVQIILAGQPELYDLLMGPGMSQVTQRIGAEYHLGPLKIEDTVNYIRHRLKVAGCKDVLFDQSACIAIQIFSRGLPRLINSLCEFSLVAGYAEERKQVDNKIIQDIMRKRPILYNDWLKQMTNWDVSLIEELNEITGGDLVTEMDP